MAIADLDGIIAGAQNPNFFFKAVTGTLVAGRPHTLNLMAGIPAVSVLGNAAGNLPNSWTITAISKANPTVVTVTGSHPWANNDTVSFQGTNSTPSLDGTDYAITNTGASTFTVPVNVTVAGTAGRCCGQTSNGGAGLNGYALTSFSGQIPFSNPVSGNTYLSRFLGFSSAQAGTLLLCDRLWHNGGYMPTKTTIQTAATPVQIPARDASGTNAGVGVYAALEVYSALGAGTPTPTLTYTDSGGTAGATATTLTALTASSIAGTFHPFALAAGDVGIQKVQSVTLGATVTSGQFGIVLYRVLAALELPIAAVPYAIDAITGGFTRMYDNTCPFLVFIPNTTTTSNINGCVNWTQG
jgi:hypothetical protein